MKAGKFLFLLLSCGSLLACTEEEDTQPVTLQTTWQMYTTQMLVMGGSEACNFKTKPSDMYGAPTSSSCQDDDVYDFTNTDEVVIQHGSQKCSGSEPASSTKGYKQTGDKLVIDRTEYSIVMLTKDTLILDYCAPLPAATSYTYGKVAMKLFRKK